MTDMVRYHRHGRTFGHGRRQRERHTLIVSPDNMKKAQVIANLLTSSSGRNSYCWELIGLADIMRGASDPSETAIGTADQTNGRTSALLRIS